MRGAKRGIAASLSDSVLSAAGTFSIGIVALRVLDSNSVALYALTFSAGVAAMIVPQHMGYLPRRLAINRQQQRIRPNYLLDLHGTLPYTGVAACAVALSSIPLWHLSDSTGLILLILGGIAWITASSFQDHVRTSLHISANHFTASAVSLVQILVIVAVCAPVVLNVDASTRLTLPSFPFAVLAIANFISGLAGVLAHSRLRSAAPRQAVPFGVSLKTAVSGFLLQGGNYASSLCIVTILGSATLAELESVRISAQPVMIAGTALAAFFVPPAIRMQQAGDRNGALKQVARMCVILLVVGAVFTVIVPPFTILIEFLTGRQTSAGLAMALVAAFALQAIIAPMNQLNIANSQYALAALSTMASIALTLATLLVTLHVLLLWAVPLAIALGAILRAVILVIAERVDRKRSRPSD